MRRQLPALVLLFAACALSACEAELVGPPGPAGPPGNANVTALTLEFEMDEASYNGSVASAGFTVPAITPSVVDYGAVMVYFYEQGTWTAMPYMFADESPNLEAVDYTITLGYAYDDRFLEVFYEASTDAIDLSLQPDREMKVVIIDGYPAGKASPDLRDYHAVMEYYGLDG